MRANNIFTTMTSTANTESWSYSHGHSIEVTLQKLLKVIFIYHHSSIKENFPLKPIFIMTLYPEFKMELSNGIVDT